MRKIGLFVCIFGIMFYASMAHSVEKAKWVEEATSITENNLNDVCAVDAGSAWAVGDYGTILRRAAATNMWECIAQDFMQQNIYRAYNFYGVHALKNNANYVWIVGVDYSVGNGVLLRTTDGGENWELKTDIYQTIPTAFKSVKFNNEWQGYISGDNGTILYSSDGGENWDRRPSPPTWWFWNFNETCDMPPLIVPV